MALESLYNRPRHTHLTNVFSCSHYRETVYQQCFQDLVLDAHFSKHISMRQLSTQLSLMSNCLKIVLINKNIYFE